MESEKRYFRIVVHRIPECRLLDPEYYYEWDLSSYSDAGAIKRVEDRYRWDNGSYHICSITEISRWDFRGEGRTKRLSEGVCYERGYLR